MTETMTPDLATVELPTGPSLIDRPAEQATGSNQPAPGRPYGSTSDGRARKKPGPPKGSPQRGGRLGTGKKPPSSTPVRKPPPKVDYRPGIAGLSQLVCLPLAFSQPLDAWAIAEHTPPIAEALNNLAHERPEVAAVLDKLLQVGPYGELIAAVMGLGIQLAANHKLLPDQVVEQLGAVPREMLVAELARRDAAA